MFFAPSSFDKEIVMASNAALVAEYSEAPKRVFACTRTDIDDIAALIAKQFQSCLDSKYRPQNIDVETLMKSFYRYLFNRCKYC